jgi:hypothetical protein
MITLHLFQAADPLVSQAPLWCPPPAGPLDCTMPDPPPIKPNLPGFDLWGSEVGHQG